MAEFRWWFKAYHVEKLYFMLDRIVNELNFVEHEVELADIGPEIRARALNNIRDAKELLKLARDAIGIAVRRRVLRRMRRAMAGPTGETPEKTPEEILEEELRFPEEELWEELGEGG